MAVLLASAGCSNSVALAVADETLGQARKRDFDYLGVLRSAQRGDASSVGELMRFGLETDAAGAIGHGVVLVELLQKLGDAAFANAVRKRSSAVREAVKRAVIAGEDYVRPPLQRPVSEGFPQSWQALNRE